MHTPKCHCLVDPCPPPDSWKIIYCPLHDAAPDMLAALKRLVIWSERTWAGGSDEVPNLKEARAAIAKAEGKEISDRPLDRPKGNR